MDPAQGNFSKCQVQPCGRSRLLVSRPHILCSVRLQHTHTHTHTHTHILCGITVGVFCVHTSAGFQVEIDLSKSPNNRVKSINILCTGCRVPRYEPLEDDAAYKVVMPSYLVDGGDGYTMIKEEKLKHDSGKAMARTRVILLR